MSYHHGIGGVTTIQGPLPTYAATTSGPISAGGLPGVVIVGGLAVAGFLVYRHFKKKGRTP